MDEDAKCHSVRTRLGSLPPHVEGNVNGYLSMTVDNFKWRSELHGEVYVCVSWWGEKQKILFLPQVTNVSDKSHISFKNTYIYRIMTNAELFLSYLQDCEELNFEVYEQGIDCLVGTATLKHLMSVVLNNPLTKSCVVIDKNGTEIADLSISFVFHQNVSTCGVTDIKNRSKRTSERFTGCEMHETLKSSEESRNCTDGETCVNKLYSSSLPKTRLDSSAGKDSMNLNENADVVSNSTISELLEQCYNIRQEYHNDGRKLLQLSKKSIEKSLTSTDVNIRNCPLGGKMSLDGELAALETFKFRTPVQELIQLAERSNQSFDGNVKCGKSSYVKIPQDQLNVSSQDSCLQSESGDFYAFEKQRKDSRNEERKTESGKQSNDAFFSSEQNRNMRFIRLTIQTLSLNYVGMQRVLVLSRALSSSTRIHKTPCGRQLPSGIVYFVEYEIPQYLRVHSNNSRKIKRPWNCNVYRMCSRQKSGKCIHFHRQMIHMLASQTPRFRELLCNSSVTFKVYSRHVNQRLPCLIGEASLSLGKVIKKFAFNALQELSIHPQSEFYPGSLLSLGILKLKIEFGSSRTCFEQKPDSSVVFQSLPSSSESEYNSENVGTCTMKISKCSNLSTKKQNKHNKISCDVDVDRRNYSKDNVRKTKFETGYISKNCSDKKETLLFGLLHVSSGKDFKSSGSYLVSHGFWKEDIMTSDVCWQTNNPNFKFHKIMPVLLSLELLDRCYNNFMVVEVWSQSGLVGITKMPLNQFYIAFRDPPVVEQLLTSKYPIISVDGWVDTVDPVSLHQVGKLNVVLALGTENQIQMLEMSRCMKDGIINPQTVSQSFTAELDRIISRSVTPANSSAENETVTKVRYGECSQNEEDLQAYNKHSADKYLQEFGSIISRESLFTSGDYSNEYSQKLICEDSNRDEHFRERKSSLQSSQNSQVFRTESFPTCFSGSSVNNGMRQGEFSEASLVQETVPETVQSNLDLVEISKENCPMRIDFSATQIPRHVLQSHINILPKLNSDAKVKISSQIIPDEMLPHKSKSVDNAFGESDSSLFNEEVQIFKKKQGNVSTDNTADVMNTDKQCHSNKICDTTPHYNSEEDFIGKSLNISELISVDENNYICKEVENLSNDTQNQCVEDSVCDDLYKSVTVADMNNISKINIDLRNTGASDLLNYQLCKSSDSFSIAGVTENASTQTDILSDENFFAMIEIINALYIAKLDNGKLPNCYVTLPTANNSVMSTPVICENTDPVWNWSCEVWLPAILLGNNGRCLILKVWHKKDDNSEHPNAFEDLVIGFVALDLQVLVCGLPSISGWFNICDISGSCKGQMQICVTPLENVSLLLNKTDCKDIKGKENEDFTEATVTRFLHSSLEKCIDPIHQEPTVAEQNSTSCSVSHDVNAIVHSSEPNQELYRSLYIDGKLVRNESPEGSEKINKSQKQINFVSSNPEKSSRSVTNQSSEYFDSIDGDCTSSLTEILRQKLQELDNIIQKMISKSDPHAKIIPRNICSENKLMNKLTDQEYYREPTQYYKAPSVNISLGKKSDDGDFLVNCKIFSALKEMVSKSEHLESSTSCSLPLQESEDGFCNSSSSVTIPTRCTSATIDGSKSRREREKSTVTDVSDNVLVTDLMTDHLMYEALHELEIENIFNPLLFQHILANHQCQRCCPQWFGKTNKSSFSSHENDNASLLPSKRNIRHFWKSQKFLKILSSISDDTCVDVGEPTLSTTKDCRKNSVRNEFLSNLTGQVIVDANQAHSGNERVTFLANTESSEPYVEANCEHLSFSKCLNMQNIGTNLNSHELKHSIKTNSKEKDCLRSIEFLNNRKHSCHPNGLECASLNSYMKCQDHKFLNVTSLSDDVEDIEELGNCNSKLKNKHTSTQHPVSISAISSEKSLALDLSSQVTEPSDDISKRPDQTLHIGKVNSKKYKEREKERAFFSNVDLEGYPIVLNENELMDLVNNMKHMMNG